MIDDGLRYPWYTSAGILRLYEARTRLYPRAQTLWEVATRVRQASALISQMSNVYSSSCEIFSTNWRFNSDFQKTTAGVQQSRSLYGCTGTHVVPLRAGPGTEANAVQASVS